MLLGIPGDKVILGVNIEKQRERQKDRNLI